MPMHKFDPYSELGVELDASDDDVRRAFRDRAKETHPDAGGDRDEFERASRAQLILLDPVRRRKFDQTGDADDPQINGPDHGALTMISDVLTMIVADESQDPFKHDLIEVIRNTLKSVVQKEADGIARVERSIKRIAKMRKRFRLKKTGNNVFERMLAYNESQLREMLQKQEGIKAARARAIEILAEYEFEKDAEQFVQRFVQFGAGTSSTTHVW